MLFVRDEVDVLPWNLDWYARMGVRTVVVDDGSTDGTEGVIAEAVRSGTIAASYRVETDEYDLPLLLEIVLELAARQNPEILLLTGADEFFEVADGGDLVSAVAGDLASGYNAVAVANMEFCMTAIDDHLEPNPVRRLRHYTHRQGKLIRAYRHVEGMSLAAGMSHRPVFPAGTTLDVSPRAYVSRHYPLRSAVQLRRKLTRVRPSRRYPDACGHYLHLFENESSAIVDPSRLAYYDEDHVWDYSKRLGRARRKEAVRALAHLFLAHEELERRYADLQRRYNELTSPSTAHAAAADVQPERP